MGEATNTIFAVLLFVVAFLGSGAYAVLSLADFRAARRGFWATAISFAIIGFVLGIMTTWPLSVRIGACAAFCAVAGGGLIWILHYLDVRQAALSLTTIDPSPQVPAPPPASAEPGVLLDFSPEPLPRLSPSNGTIRIFEIREQHGQIQAGLTDYQFDPNIVIDWRNAVPEWPIFGVTRCEITSTTNEFVFDAVIRLELRFQEMVQDPEHPEQSRSGKLLSIQNSQFNVGRISPRDSYVLYFLNRTKYLVSIAISKESVWQDFNVPGPDFKKQLHLRIGRKLGLLLSPIPQPTSLPEPSPLSTPKEKSR